MPSLASSRLDELAGIHIPARYETLGNLLNICLEPGQTTESIVAAIELDPAILCAFLNLREATDQPVSHWHQDLDPGFVPAFATALALEHLIEEPDQEESWRRLLGWRKSMLHSLLAAQLATTLETAGQDEDEARLAGLFAGLGPDLMIALTGRRQPQPFVDIVQQSDEEQAALTAELLAARGCPQGFCDAVRFQYANFEELADTSGLIRIVAGAGRLVEFVQGPDMLDAELAGEFHRLFGISEDGLYALIGEVSRQFDGVLSQLELENAFERPERAVHYPPIPAASTGPSCQFKQNLNQATLTAVFQNSLLQAGKEADIDHLIRGTGKFLFGFDTAIHLEPNPDRLEQTVGTDDKISITRSSPRSLIARSYRNQQIATATLEELSSIADKQLLNRTRSEALVSIPLGTASGVLVCGIDHASRNRLSERQYMLNRFAEVAARLYAREHESDRISPERVRKRLSEIVHEANNPLSIVQNYLRTLSLKLGEDNELQSDIDNIGNEIMRASEIIRKFRDVDFEEDVSASEIDINDVIQKLTDLFRGGQRDINFITDFDPVMPPITVQTDDLQQILVNLIKNAVEALMADERILDRGKRVTISTCGTINIAGQDHVEISITDNGPGIRPDIREKLFEPHASIKGGDHSGIGLSIVKQLTDKLGGMVTCKTRVEGEGTPGTTFQVLLPRHEQR